ncbi:MAG TPA: carboxypeptidase-like regulatory domain-containing protein, partial [Flavobacteriales bacterium]|nr:carboxypeptidase-like regulatory domain-containing protein [Flavobacteriales bacterium]
NPSIMSSHKVHIAAALSVIMLLAGCAKDGDTGPAGSTGPAGPSLSGNLTGFVSLYDQYGAHLLLDNDSSIVTVDGTSWQSWSDSLGRYTINDLHTGIYNLTCTHAGFGESKVNSLQFAGGGDLYRDIRLSAIPSFQLDSISVTTGVGGLAITGHLAMDAQQRTVLIFAGGAANTSADPATYLSFYSRSVMANQATFTLQIPTGDLYAMGLTSGATVYFAAYGATPNFNNSSSYQDLNTGRTVFTAISANAALRSGLVP